MQSGSRTATEAAQVIKKLTDLTKHMREANGWEEGVGLSEDEIAFCDALETNDSAVIELRCLIKNRSLREVSLPQSKYSLT